MTSCGQCEALEAANARNRELEGQVAQLEKERDELHEQLAEMTKLCELQQADLERYRKAYEASRPNHPERVAREQLQLAFARVLEALADADPANDGDDNPAVESGDEQTPTQPSGGERKRKRRHPHGRRPLDLSGLEVKEIVLDPAEVKSAPDGWVLIGQEVADRVAWRPGAYIRIRFVRPKYIAASALAAEAPASASDSEASSDSDEAVADGAGELWEVSSEVADDESTTVIIAPLPDSVWPRFMADPSAIGHVIVSKYDDLLPLNRQEGISARHGFVVPKSTQCGWLGAAYSYCAPVVEAMFAEAKGQAFCIATDATGVRVRPQVKGAECDSWHVFVFIADRDHVVFRYSPEHTSEAVTEMLAGYRGHLLADAATIYDVLYREHGMTEVGCWYHCRRGFYRAIETEPEPALEAMSLIGKLFEVERDCRKLGLDVEAFTRERAARAGPVLKMLDQWVDLHRESADPRGPLKQAIGYYENQRDALQRFMTDGRLRLDNCPSEQQLRKLVLGQHNWSFFANETGLAWFTTFRSLIASCALHGLNCQLYLEQLLRIAPHWPRNRVLELSPKYWTRTLAGLDARWRAILARPWEDGACAHSASATTDPAQQSAA